MLCKFCFHLTLHLFPLFAHLFLVSLNRMRPRLVDDDLVTQHKERRKQEKHKNQTEQSSSSDQMSQISDRCGRRNQMNDITGKRDDRARCEDRGTGLGDR